MTKETFKGIIESANGKKLRELTQKDGSPIAGLDAAGRLNYSTEYTYFDSIEELKSAPDAYPSDKDILNFVNAQRKANARAAAINKELENAGVVKPTLENDDQMVLRTIYKGLIAAKKSHEEARAIASQSTGIAWAD
jgi:hypothetical protein